jgi:hypothetical protein
VFTLLANRLDKATLSELLLHTVYNPEARRGLSHVLSRGGDKDARHRIKICDDRRRLKNTSQSNYY